MKATYKLLKLDELEATMTITMSVQHWYYVKEALKDSSKHSWASDNFMYMVRALIVHAEQTLEETVETEGED